MSLTAYASLKTPHCGVFRALGAPRIPFGRNEFVKSEVIQKENEKTYCILK